MKMHSKMMMTSRTESAIVVDAGYLTSETNQEITFAFSGFQKDICLTLVCFHHALKYNCQFCLDQLFVDMQPDRQVLARLSVGLWDCGTLSNNENVL
jgi:hypothetical protein